MSNKRILIFGTYPIANPQHGGQKRVSAIVEQYQKAGHTVEYVAVFHRPFYDHYSKNDIILTGSFAKAVSSSPFTGDVVSGEAIHKDVITKNKIADKIRTFNPDIIQIEQIFPYIGLEKLLEELAFTGKLISSTHNIEYEMKQEMLVSLGQNKQEIAKTVGAIKNAEVAITTKADLVIAVSQEDKNKLKTMGAKKVILCPNGINKNIVNEADVLYWKTIFKKIGVEKIALFVGSAHPPNWIGFQAMIGRGLGFLPSNARVVFAGSISEYIENELDKLRYDVGATTFYKRAFFAGRLSEARLTGLLNIADVILLPITEGGGSNLKTAEAIVSGKKIVATSFAFRGFENIKTLSNITVKDDPEEFRKAIVTSFGSDLKKRNDNELELERAVLWDNCLSQAVQEVGLL